ncbi:MAG: bacillithiol biosynthesis cysteine-adding enzyme BshC [bacterium]
MFDFVAEATVRFGLLPGFNATWTRVIEDRSSASSLFLRSAANLEGVKAAQEEQLAQTRDWKALADILEAAGKRYGVPAGALARLEELAAGKAAAIVSAQQVGYLGGPLYTFLKAYHCVRLASLLERELGKPLLPIFWLEDEDHDLAEIADSYYLEESGEISNAHFSPETPVANFAAGHYEVRASVLDPIREMTERIGVPRTTETEALLAECYAGQTLSDGMGRLLARLLGERGLLVVEGSHAGLKRLAAPLWARILDVGPALHKLLSTRGEFLESLGLPAPLSPTPSAYLFYQMRNDFIRRVVSYDGTLRDPGGHEETVTLHELRDSITAHPEIVSPKAALRPLYQDFVLPTAAYIAGPMEIAYHAQIQPFYKILSVAAPSLFPRLSVTIMDEKTSHLSQKVGFTPRRILESDFDALAKKMLDRTDDAGIGDSFEETRRKLEEAMRALKPRGLLSEQGLSTAYFLLRFGRERLLAALDEVPLDSKKHVVLSVSTEHGVVAV